MSTTNQSSRTSNSSNSESNTLVMYSSEYSDEYIFAREVKDKFLPEYVDKWDEFYISTVSSKFDRDLSNLVPYRHGDTSFTRSDILDFTSQEFEYRFAPVWAGYRKGKNWKDGCRDPFPARYDKELIADDPALTQSHPPKTGMIVPDTPDHGLDLIEWHTPDAQTHELEPREYRFFQLKQYDDTRVSAPEVQAFIGACFEHQSYLTHGKHDMHSLDNAYLVTTSDLTGPADEVIENFNNHRDTEFNIQVIDSDTVVRLFRRFSSGRALTPTIDEIKKRYLHNSVDPFPL